MAKKTTLATIAQETLQICEQGFYLNADSEQVNLKRLIQEAETNTIHYQPEDFANVFQKRNAILDKLNEQTIFEVHNETALSACKRVVYEEGFKKVLALNFASAKNPGGGFLSGAQAQEESLARASALYVCQTSKPKFYETHRGMDTCLYTDNMIYSPQVPVFRDDKGNLLSESYQISFITSPAVNQNGMNAKKEKVENYLQIPQIMQARAEKLLSIALIHQYEVLVLGAWGCGVFHNQPVQVAEYFRYHLKENPVFQKAFKKVVFAVLDSSKEEKAIKPFQEIFVG